MSDLVSLRPPLLDGGEIHVAVDGPCLTPSDALRPLVAVLAEIAERIERERLAGASESDAA